MNIEMKIRALADISDRLAHTGVKFTLGGSALLFAHGLVTEFNDIDLLTEDREDKVLNALHGIELQKTPNSGIYSSKFFYEFKYGGVDFDLMGHFSIAGPNSKSIVHSIEDGRWNGIPLGSLRVWKRAYELMGRPERAALIPAISDKKGKP